MNTEKFFEGPGSSDMMTYVWEIALILGVAFLLGYWLRYLLSGSLKTRITELEAENSKLYNASKGMEENVNTLDRAEIKLGEQKAEIDRLNSKLSECFATRIKAENQLAALQTKYDALSLMAPAVENTSSATTKISTEESASGIVAASGIAKPTKDDLKKIEGIGPKIEQLLNADGILNYKELIKASVERIKGILTAAGPNYAVHDPSTWGEQAQLADDGNWEALDLLQEELKGGKRK